MSGVVTTEAALDAELVTVAAQSSGSFTVTLGAGITLDSDLEAINLQSGVTLTLDGAGNVINGQSLYSALFVYAGNVTIENLSLDSTAAFGGAGGNGSEGGGGGAGLGGGLFVAAGGTVTLSGVVFSSDHAQGGAGGNLLSRTVFLGAGGGGGLGGAGGSAKQAGGITAGGGGGIGASATGADAGDAAGLGIVPSAAGGAGGDVYGGAGGTTYAGAGHGGGGGTAFQIATGTLRTVLGGGGGILGSAGYLLRGAPVYYAGAGGFGGGGGGAYGAGNSVIENGGRGGFGGGGGGAGKSGKYGGIGGYGGFGGGRGGGTSAGGSYTGGGGSYLGNPSAMDIYSAGGGGLGAGGDVFVQSGGALVVRAGSWSGGSVAGGAGGTGVGGLGAGYAGSAKGSGLFMDGTGTVTLAPGAGQTLTITDSIVDDTGAFGTGDPMAAGIQIGAGTVRLLAANPYAGATTIGPGGTLELGTALSAGQNTLAFSNAAGTGDLAILDVTPVFTLDITGFAAADTIDLTKLTYQSGGFSGSYTAQTPHAAAALVIDGTRRVTLEVSGSGYTFGKFRFAPDAGTGTLLELACFAAGTRILTSSGERAVETLGVGDLVPELTTRRLRRVVWTGCKTVIPAAHKRPEDVLPVRVCRDAFGPGMPHRDLVLSPEHCLLRDGVLVPVRHFIGRRGIVQETAAEMTYWHVELDTHGVLLAEGLHVESYLDPGDRAGFATGACVRASLFAQAAREARACATLRFPPG